VASPPRGRTYGGCRSPAAPPEPPLTVIEAGSPWRLIELAELWRYRDLLYCLTRRDVAVRYKQTVLGVLWAVLQPLLTMVVFTVFFGRIAGLDRTTGQMPYPLFVYAGLLPWTLFSQSVMRSSQSLVSARRLVTKVYFPRLLIPAAATGACLVDFAIAAGLLGVMMLSYGAAPSAALAATPLLLVLTLGTALAVGNLVSALTVSYRDFRYVVPFMMQLWMLATPAIYARSLLSGRWQWLAALNPLNAVVEGWRACLLAGSPDWPGIALAAAMIAVLFVVGLAYFRHSEARFADVI
jgi:lipopolysaccharide transport system permease protein